MTTRSQSKKLISSSNVLKLLTGFGGFAWFLWKTILKVQKSH